MIRKCSVNDVEKVRQFIRHTPPLDVHTVFSYWVMFRYFDELCWLVEDEPNGKIIGFVGGVIGANSQPVPYLWQLGVDTDYRNTPLASKLLYQFTKSVKNKGFQRIQFSIDPNNKPSLNTALRYAHRNKLEIRQIGSIDVIDEIESRNVYEILYEINLA